MLDGLHARAQRLDGVVREHRDALGDDHRPRVDTVVDVVDGGGGLGHARGEHVLDRAWPWEAGERGGVRVDDPAAVAREERDAAMAAWLEERGVELVVCAGFMHLLRAPFLERYRGRIVNTHSAPLPEFPGPRPIEDVLAARAPETAATVHFVDEGVDTGAVIAAERVPVHAGDTVETLRARVQAAEHRLLPRVVRELVHA